jgi:hypothetical protein
VTDEWNATVDIKLDRLRDFFLPADLPSDLSPGSLRPLETLLLERYAPEPAPLPAGDDFIESLLAYVGEVAIRLVGGEWRIGRDGVPFVVPDPALGLPAIHPLSSLSEALHERTGKVLISAAERWHEAAARHPEFAPPAVAAQGPSPAGGDRLAVWLAERERAFPRWLSDYAEGGAGYDFGPESLPAFQEMLRRRLPSGGADAPENEELLAGAAWYFGEVITRNKPAATWVTPAPGHPDPDEHYLYNAERDASTHPFMAIRLTTEPDDLVPLRRMYDIFR